MNDTGLNKWHFWGAGVSVLVAGLGLLGAAISYQAGKQQAAQLNAQLDPAYRIPPPQSQQK